MTLPRKGEIWITPDGTRVEWLRDMGKSDVLTCESCLVNGCPPNPGDQAASGLFNDTMSGPGLNVVITQAQ